MESGRQRAPLHLKVLAYHHDLVEQGEAPPLELLDLKTVLMPRQWLLKKLDPDGTLTVPALMMILEQHMREYADVVLKSREPPRVYSQEGNEHQQEYSLHVLAARLG